MTQRNEPVIFTARDYVEAVVFSAVLILGLPASIFVGMAIAG